MGTLLLHKIYYKDYDNVQLEFNKKNLTSVGNKH